MPATETQTDSALLGVYKPSGPVFTGGEGCELIAEDGRRFLDFTSGIAVNALGYGDPDVAAAIRGALDGGLIHTSNLFRTQPAAELAGWLTENSFADRVFFCNSGAEANEARHQVRAALRGRGPARDHRLSRRLPRPDDGRAGRHGPRRVPGPVPPPDARRRLLRRGRHGGGGPAAGAGKAPRPCSSSPSRPRAA